MFSFSKLICLRKRYKLSSAGNKFPSFLILLFVNANNSLFNVNRPLFFVVMLFHSFLQVFDWLHIHFNLKYPYYSFTSISFRTAVRPRRPFTCPPKQMYMQFSLMTLLSSTQPDLVLEVICSVWKPPPAGCLLLHASFFRSCGRWSLPPVARWLQDTSLIPGVNGVAGLGAPKFELFFVFCRTFLRLATCDLGLEITMKMFLFGFELSFATYKSWPALSLWIFSQTVLFDHRPNSSTVFLKTWLPKFYGQKEGLLRYSDMLEWSPFPLVRSWLWNVVLTQFTVSWPSKWRN